MGHDENPRFKSIDDLIDALPIIIRQEITRALQSEKPDKLLTVSEAAEYLRLAIPTIYSLVQHNKIPYMKKTKRLYFSEIKLKEWLDQSRVRSNYEREKEVINKLVKRKSVHRMK
ncbi:MAG: helix-turn-helix domain-containing protein [Chlorobiaceae bacterium]